MKSTRMACLLAITASLAACVTPAGRADPPGALDRSDLFYGTQVSTGPCAGESEAVSFLATLAGAVISRGVDRLGAALQSAAGKDVQTTLARRNVEMSATGFGPCVFVVRGWFHRNNPSPRDASLEFHPEPDSAFPFNTRNRMGELWRLGLWASATPDFYFQGRVVTNSTRTAYTIIPLEATLDRPISAHSLRSDRRSVVITFALASGGASTFQSGGSAVVLGELQPGVLRTFPPAECIVVVRSEPADQVVREAESAGCPDGPTSPPDATRIIRTAFESEWFAPALSDDLKPMTLLAQVQETRDEAVFWGHVAAIFTGVQQAGTTALQHTLVPELGASAAETETTARETALNNYDTALSATITALDACVSTPADTAKRTAARTTIRSYIAAARRAGVTARLSEAHIDAITPFGDESAPCLTARNALRN